MTSQPTINIAQAVLSSAQDFLPTGVRSLPWQLASALFPTLDATPAMRRLFWFSTSHVMVGALQFNIDLPETPPNVLHRFHHVFCGNQNDASRVFRAELVLPAAPAGLPTRITLATLNSPDGIALNSIVDAAAVGILASPGKHIDVPPRAHLLLQSLGNNAVGNVIRFGYFVEELAAPVVNEVRDLGGVITEI